MLTFERLFSTINIMKYLNIILTIIAVLLLSITLKLINISAQLNISNQNNQAALNFSQELINSNFRLERSFSSLAEEVVKLNDKFLSKEGRRTENAK